MDPSQAAEQVVRIAMPVIVSVVDPELILPHLQCIPRPRQSTIRCKQERSGKEIATQELLLFLYGRDDWFNQLCSALKHPDVDCQELAGKLEDEFYKKCRRPISGHSVNQVDEKTPVRALKSEIRRSFCRLGSNALANWQIFADKVGYTVDDMGRFQDRPNPAEALFQDWVTRAEATLGTLVMILQSMDRDDILTELKASQVGPAVKHILSKLHSEGVLEIRQPLRKDDTRSSTRFGKGSNCRKLKQHTESYTYACDVKDTQKCHPVTKLHERWEKQFDISASKNFHDEQQQQLPNKTDKAATGERLDENQDLSHLMADSPTFPPTKPQPSDDETLSKGPYSLAQGAEDAVKPSMFNQNLMRLGAAALGRLVYLIWPNK